MVDPTHDCCLGPGLRHYVDCLEDMYREAATLTPQHILLSKAVGHVLAENLKAPLSLPTFNNSAMDGFAFKASAVREATPDAPVQLPVVGASIAGDRTGLAAIETGQAVKVMTGAPMPDGTNTVLPVEAASWEAEVLTFLGPYEVEKHVRQVGQDVHQGTVILKTGTQIAAHHLPLLSALGIGRVPVYPKPSVAWVSTGQEIWDDFNTLLPAGKIYNATRLYGEAVAADMGYCVQSATTVRDTPEDFAAALDAAIATNPELILSTGGISAGQYDFVKPVLEDFGARIIFHKARIKPAKPVLFAKLRNGSYFFGLPGNPISTALALRAFVHPFVRAMTGMQPEGLRSARLVKDVRTTSSKTVFLMAELTASEDGLLLANPDHQQQSFQTSPFSRCNAWLMVPEGVSELEAGDLVHWFPFNPCSAEGFPT